MSRAARFLVALAALSMAVVYVLPLWHIGLKAPQYPEGLGLYIAVDKIVGEKTQDLNSINGLNHYIGMKVISPDDIPELQYMPKIIVGLIALGLLTAAVGKRSVLTAYAGVLRALFGRRDSPTSINGPTTTDTTSVRTAIIKIPGMTYQPPLIGSKQLLNFHATSWPASGGWVLIAAVTLVAVLAIRSWRSPMAAQA